MKPRTDLADKIAIGVYGKTGRANARQNDNPEFQAGYKRGCDLGDLEPFDAIGIEWKRRGSPVRELSSFREWKRGLWAAVMQRAVAKAKE